MMLRVSRSPRARFRAACAADLLRAVCLAIICSGQPAFSQTTSIESRFGVPTPNGCDATLTACGTSPCGSTWCAACVPFAGYDAHIVFTVVNSPLVWHRYGPEDPCQQFGLPSSGQTIVYVSISGSCGTGSGSLKITVTPTPPAPTVTAPSEAGENSPNRIASVPAHAGSTYAWSITNGTITAGQGTPEVTFRTGFFEVNPPTGLSVIETDANGCNSLAGTATVSLLRSGAFPLYTLTPCRLIDTRQENGPLGGPALEANQVRSFTVGGCGIPTSAKAISANVTVTEPGAPGYVTLFPGITPPQVSTVNFGTGQTRASNTVTMLKRYNGAAAAGTFAILNGSLGTVHVIVDVTGYFD
jgi:hypothetical protein